MEKNEKNLQEITEEDVSTKEDEAKNAVKKMV